MKTFDYSGSDASESAQGIRDFLDGEFQDWISDGKARVTFVELDSVHAFVLVGDGNGNVVLQQQWGQSWSLQYWNDDTGAMHPPGHKNYLRPEVEAQKQALRNRFGAYRSFRLDENDLRGALFKLALSGVGHVFSHSSALLNKDIDEAIFAVFGPAPFFKDGSKIIFHSMVVPWADSGILWC